MGMNMRMMRRGTLLSVLAGVCLLAGPCGITTLQFREFVESTAIRTATSTFFSILEAATLAQAAG